MKSNLPRILYISDVPVELCYAGPTLIHRLLEDYPANSLLIVQGMEINKAGRLPGVEYRLQRSTLMDRLKVSRLREWITGLLIFNEWINYRHLISLTKQFRPDVIVTVSFRLKWLQAFWLSKRNNIPLHVILHDDWLLTENYGFWQDYLSRRFKGMYRAAMGKYCISHAMEEYYRELLGIKGSILSPIRGRADKIWPYHLRDLGNKKIRYCYAGTLFTSEFASLLDRLSHAIHNAGGELHLFSTESAAALSAYPNLNLPHVVHHGLLAPDLLQKTLHDEMDVAILVNSFEAEVAFRYNFSSKLVDYSSAGLPVLIWGPASSGAISWAIGCGYNGIVLENIDSLMESMVIRMTNSQFRMSLARHMQEMGIEQFDYQKNRDVFLNGITATPR